MSEGGGTSGPEIAPGPTSYNNSNNSVSYSNPPSQPPTPSSTVQDPPNYTSAEESSESKQTSSSGLPPFSSFSSADVAEGLGGRLASDGYLSSEGISSTRIMELSGWDYCYTDGRYLDGRGEPMPVMVPQPQYRPWESKQEGAPDGKSGLPSFQSQFGEELVTTLTTLTPAACSPAPSVPSPSLPSFHTLSAVNPRYPLVPAPVQAREIPSIQQQFLDERHIHLFQGAPGQNFALQPQNGTLTSLNNATTLTTLNNAQYHINNAQLLPSGQILAPQSHILAPSSQLLTSNGHIITSTGGQGLAVVSQNSTPTVLTVVKAEPVNIVELKSANSQDHSLTQLHHPHFHNPLISQGHHMESKFGLDSPPRGIDGRKKERRKIRASSLESSNESDGAMSVESSGQVAAVSSTAGFKSPMTPSHMGSEDFSFSGDGMITDTGEKQTKKKRKRCGECIGCQRKDNCGDCAPCRNDKSHQICKMRRCEKLTEKKHLLAYNREDGGVNFRSRGRGRGRGSRGGYRGKAPRPGSATSQVSSVTGEMNSAPGIGASNGRESVKSEAVRVNSLPNTALPPTMAVPFYGGSDVWPGSNPSDTWTAQGQFVPQIDEIRYQHYPGYQPQGASYQQNSFGTEQPSAFQPQYGSQPSPSPAQGSVTPRPPSNYSQVQPPTPSPIGSNPPTPHVNGHRNGISVHYVEDGGYVNGNSFSSESSMAPPSSTPPTSRSNSALGNEGSEPTVSKAGYMSGNDLPGYPANSPQPQSLCNSNGYPGQSNQSEYGDQTNGAQYQTNQKSPYNQPHPSPGYQSQNYQNYNHISPEQQIQRSPSQKQSGFPQHSPKNFSPVPSPSYQMYDNRQGGNYYGDHYEKTNVNARIKTMIMNKQGRNDNGSPLTSPNGKDRPPNDYGGKKLVDESEESNHFLAFSHHLREGSILHPGGGGGQNWGSPVLAPNFKNEAQYYLPYDHNKNNLEGVSAMEKFMKFVSADFDKVKPYAPVEMGKKIAVTDLSPKMQYHSKLPDPIRNLETNFPTKRNTKSTPNYEFCEEMLPRSASDFSSRNYTHSDVKSEFPDLNFLESNSIKTEPKTEDGNEMSFEEEDSDSLYPRVSYAPGVKHMKVVDKRFGDKTNEGCEQWVEYLKETEEERKCAKPKTGEPTYPYEGDGGPIRIEEVAGSWCCRKGGTKMPTAEHLKDGCCQGLQTEDEITLEQSDGNKCSETEKECGDDEIRYKKTQLTDNLESTERLKNLMRSDMPDCSCFPPDKAPPEPGSYYTHLGAAATLKELRQSLENRLQQVGNSLRIEKICYTGKEGKTTQGCPLAKWVIRRKGLEEKFLVMVKQRPGHLCGTAWIVVCIIAWEGVPTEEADKSYNVLAHKLNRFGLPTTRRCATNEPRTCACQGLDPDTCGTSFSFGCSWSMYYNGCKYARSKTVRKFRLSVRAEEQELEERMHVLSTLLSPLYNKVAPNAFDNQTVCEREASECRLGFKPGRPFSGVTVCVDFCAHAHRDLHNMNNGCTVVVSLTKHRSLSKPDDEQLHVLPLYVMDDTDEFGSKENQEIKYKDGSIECLNKFPCEVRVRSVPLQPCRRHGKKRKDEDSENATLSPRGKNTYKAISPVPYVDTMFDSLDSQVQSSQVSSTVMDSPGGMYHQGWGYQPKVPEAEINLPMAWGDIQRKQNVTHPPVNNWEYSNGADPDSTTQNQVFSPCSSRSRSSYSNTMSSPQSSPMSSSQQWCYGASRDKEEEREEERPWGEYPSTPSPNTISPSSSPFRLPKGRPPSRQTHINNSEPTETFLKPLPRENYHLDHVKIEPQTSFYNNSSSTHCQQIQKPTWGEPINDRFCSAGYQNNFSEYPGRWETYGQPPPFFPVPTEPTKPEPLGEVTDFIDNEECFRDSQMGGIGIALGHGSVLFEVAKQELHATTALKRPNRGQPTRISLVFYQHRNLNRAKHGWDEWEEKMRLRKLGITGDKATTKNGSKETDITRFASLEKPISLGGRILNKVSTFTTTTWTTLFPMRPCIVTGPYQEGGGE